MRRSRFTPPTLETSTPAQDADQAAATEALMGGVTRPDPADAGSRKPSYSRYVVGQPPPASGRVEFGAAIDDVGGPPADPAANDAGPGRELEALRAQAREAGHAEGLEAGRAEAKAEVAGLVDLYKRSIERLAGLETQVVEAYREQLGELALRIAQAVIRQAVDDGTAVVALAREAMQAFNEPDALELRVAPGDARHLEAWASGRRDAGVDVQIRVDEALEPGDLHARCGAGELESRLADRLSRASELVRAAQSS